MKFEHVPIPVGTENVDPSALMVLGGVGVAVMLVAISAPRLSTLIAAVAAGVAGTMMMS